MAKCIFEDFADENGIVTLIAPSKMIRDFLESNLKNFAKEDYCIKLYPTILIPAPLGFAIDDPRVVEGEDMLEIRIQREALKKQSSFSIQLFTSNLLLFLIIINSKIREAKPEVVVLSNDKEIIIGVNLNVSIYKVDTEAGENLNNKLKKSDKKLEVKIIRELYDE